MVSDIRQGVVEYLLGELSPQEAQQFEASLRADPALRAEVERFRPVVGRLEGRSDDVWVPLEPPPIDIAGIVAAGPATANLDLAEGDGLRLRNLSGAASEPSGSSGSGSPRRPRRSLAEVLGATWPRVAVGAFSALLMLAVGVGVGLQLGGDNAVTGGGPVQTFQLQAFGEEAPADASGEVLMTSGGEVSGDRMTLDVSGLAESGESEFYEAWLLGEKGELVALGSFRVPSNGKSTIEVPLPVSPDRYQYFDVSIQPENGNPQHSGRSVLRGLTSS